MRSLHAAVGTTTINPELLTAAERLQYEAYRRRQSLNAAITDLIDNVVPLKEIAHRTGHSRNLIRQISRGGSTDMFRTRHSLFMMASKTDGNQRYSWMKNRRSLSVNSTRPRSFRCNTITCCRRAAFSATSWYLGLKCKPSRFNNNSRSATIATAGERFWHQIKPERFSARTVSHVTTINQVAADLGESEDWLFDIANEMDTEDVVIWIRRIGEDTVMAFTEFAIETLIELIKIHKHGPTLLKREISQVQKPAASTEWIHWRWRRDTIFGLTPAALCAA